MTKSKQRRRLAAAVTSTVLICGGAGLGSALLTTEIHAHHNAASHYLMDQQITVEGTVLEFRLINPHVRIYFEVTGDDGTTQKWLAEGNAAGVLKRRGWTSDILEPGDHITVTGRPARDGGNKVDWETIVLADGTELRGGNTVAGEKQRQLDELEARRRQQRAQSESASD